ncbi:MAG: diaminopimelate decarboxylase [Actinomycetaceae bacterium]|nr:diaminopimelate decarboxylase [Actinomycetaceae bacterium]
MPSSRDHDPAWNPGLVEAFACPQPDERPDVWPRGVTRLKDGHLALHGQRLAEILHSTQAHTPVFVLDVDHFEDTAKAYSTAFAKHFDVPGMSGAQVHYAGKAFLTTGIAKIAASHGLGIDTASEGELRVALASGCPAELIGLHGNAKKPELIRLALRAGIGRIIADSLAEVRRISRVANEEGLRAPVMLRITTGVHAGGHDFIATAHEDQKFGLSLESGEEGWPSPAMQAAQMVDEYPNTELVGLHSHIGSQIFDMTAFEAAASKMLAFRKDLADQGIDVPELDLGGGYPVAYTDADPHAPSPDEVARILAQVVRKECEQLGTDVPKVSVEPGRSIIAPTTMTLYTVVNVKDQRIGENADGTPVYRRYVSVDGGMSDNIRPALYGSAYTATVASRVSDADLVACRVVGAHCESGDILIFHLALPMDIAEGDLLAMPVTGAYGDVMSSNYNMLARPGTLGVQAGASGQVAARWLRTPETLETLFSRDPDYSTVVIPQADEDRSEA